MNALSFFNHTYRKYDLPEEFVKLSFFWERYFFNIKIQGNSKFNEANFSKIHSTFWLNTTTYQYLYLDRNNFSEYLYRANFFLKKDPLL